MNQLNLREHEKNLSEGTGQASPEKSLVSKLGSSKLSFYNNRLAGLSSMTVNSFAQSIQQSKVNQKIEESVVMQDYFNPAKALLNKWTKKDGTEEEFRVQTNS